MTKRSKYGGPVPFHPQDVRRKVVEAIWETFVGEPIPGANDRLHLIEGRHPIYELVLVFDAIEWESTPFDPSHPKYPSHPPSREPIPGCECAHCELANLGWRIEDIS